MVEDVKKVLLEDVLRNDKEVSNQALELTWRAAVFRQVSEVCKGSAFSQGSVALHAAQLNRWAVK